MINASGAVTGLGITREYVEEVINKFGCPEGRRIGQKRCLC